MHWFIPPINSIIRIAGGIYYELQWNRKKDVSVQNIDWGHPNMMDPKLSDYNRKTSAWKREHQVKIFANVFFSVGFNVIHKNEGLYEYEFGIV